MVAKRLRNERYGDNPPIRWALAEKRGAGGMKRAKGEASSPLFREDVR